MCDQHGGSADLAICTTSPDGSAHVRHWDVCKATADGLAYWLGPPDTETLATDEGISVAAQAMDDAPGILHARWEH